MATAGIVNATLIGIYVGTSKIAMATSGSLSINQALRTSINKDDGGWEKSFGGARSWNMSGDSEFAFDSTYGPSQLADAIIAGTKLTLKFSTEVVGDIKFSGEAYIETFEISGGAEENATYSYSFKGTGAITKATV